MHKHPRTQLDKQPYLRTMITNIKIQTNKSINHKLINIFKKK